MDYIQEHLRITEKEKNKLLSQFRKKHKKVLTVLEEQAKEHKVVFCANLWTGNGTETPCFMSFDFEEVFNTAFSMGYYNSHRELTRIEYYEIGVKYPRLEEIGYIGLEEWWR